MKKILYCVALLCVAAWFTGSVAAAPRVVAVHEGDTITTLMEREQYVPEWSSVVVTMNAIDVEGGAVLQPGTFIVLPDPFGTPLTGADVARSDVLNSTLRKREELNKARYSAEYQPLIRGQPGAPQAPEFGEKNHWPLIGPLQAPVVKSSVAPQALTQTTVTMTVRVSPYRFDADGNLIGAEQAAVPDTPVTIETNDAFGGERFTIRFVADPLPSPLPTPSPTATPTPQS